MATRRLRQFGIILLRATFAAVWRLYTDFLATFGADPPDLSDAAAGAEVDWSETVLAQLRLAEAERDDHMPFRGVVWRLRHVYGEG